MTALLASFLFYSGMKDYVKVGKTDTAVVELYGDYPAVNLAKQIWENYQSSDEITDFCFVWKWRRSRWLRIQRISDRQMPG